MPSADTLWIGLHAHVQKIDLTNFTQVRIVVNKQGTAGDTNSKIRLGFAATFQTTPAGYTNIGAAAAEVAASPLNVTNTIVASAWVNLHASAKADIFLAAIGSGGNGTLDPAFGSITAEFK